MDSGNENASLNLAQFYHRNTELTEETSFQFLRQMVSENLSGKPVNYAQAESIALAPSRLDASLADCLQRRGSNKQFAPSPVRFAALSTLLTCALAPGELKENGLRQRPYPSAGGLYPVSVYLFARHVEQLDTGIYHVNAGRQVLEKLHGYAGPEALDAQLDPMIIREPDDPKPSFYLLLSGDLALIRRKYGDRGYRFMLLEAGHIAQNLCLLATALGLLHLPLGGFCEPELEQLLGVREVGLMSLYLLEFGNR